MSLRIDHEAVTALATEVADLRAAVTDIATFTKGETLTPRQFGPLGARAGEAFAALHEELLAEIEKAAPDLENAVTGLVKAAERVVEVDQDAAARITRAGER
ncbi:hypothetical protein [Actinokineospora diospyrosa]|uniref:Excreted virulence factor EspC (Type VII ESX diderm) n=1 Tax=Actinokineospora diospyrosa TaxID=103728 RepID=A0ABT1IIM6_9PSEU|nr:hypothetical protein [Actinokineospora diospyrosa]MCP2272512.1 Protein of unknown function (DUF2580) [Actinokineospora diospyrosa]